MITGGCANILGIDRIFGEIFQKNARIGHCHKIKNIDNELTNSAFSASLGALLNFQEKNKNKVYNQRESDENEGFIKKIVNKILGD